MKIKDEIPQFMHDFKYAIDNHLINDDVGQAVARLICSGIHDDLAIGLIQNRVRRHKISQLYSGPYETPSALTYGDLIQGMSQRGKEIRFPRQYLNSHSLTVGGSGSGKTTKSRFLILQIAKGLEGLWCFDFAKREFRVLKPYLARLGVNLLIVPARELRLNILQCPDHVAPRDWASKVSDILVQTLELPPRATKLLHITILKLYQEFGIFE